MRPYNTKARWYGQLTIEEAAEVDTLDTVILAANVAKARRYVIQKRAISRIQHLRKSPKDEAGALVARLKLGDNVVLQNHPSPELNGEYVVGKILQGPAK